MLVEIVYIGYCGIRGTAEIRDQTIYGRQAFTKSVCIDSKSKCV